MATNDGMEALNIGEKILNMSPMERVVYFAVVFIASYCIVTCFIGTGLI